MKKLFSSLFLLFPLATFAQESSGKTESGNMYFMAYGLIAFLALVGIKTIIDKLRDRHEAKTNLAFEEGRRMRIENDEREKKLKEENTDK